MHIRCSQYQSFFAEVNLNRKPYLGYYPCMQVPVENSNIKLQPIKKITKNALFGFEFNLPSNDKVSESLNFVCYIKFT